MKRDLVIRLRNHDFADEALDRLVARGPSPVGDGRFLFISGAAGTGKSTYVRWMAEERQAPLIVMRPTSTARSMLAELARAVRGWHVAERGVDELFVRCAEELENRRVSFVFVDEGDCLDQAPRFVLLNTLRALADRSGTAIVIFSTAALMRRFAVPTPYLEQISSRQIGQIEFGRPTLGDAMHLAEVIEGGVQLERDLVRVCLESARGSIRPLLNIYEGIEATARATGVEGNLSLARAVKLGLIVRPEKPAAGEPAAATLDGERRVA